LRFGPRALALAVSLVLTACSGDKKASDSSRLLSLHPVLDTSAPPCPAGSNTEPVLPLVKDGKAVECLRLGPPIVDDRDVRSASYSYNLDQAQPEVGIVLGSTGAANLDDFAAGHMGQRLAVVYKEKLATAPVIRTSSFVGRIVVTGLSKPEAEELFKRLKQESGG
jgi:preprotein translocase subunit SecD